MEKGRRSPAGRCGLWAASAFACFAGFEFLASVPRFAEVLRVALALAGYVSLVLLLGCTLRAWRSDWSDLWPLPTDRASRRRANVTRATPMGLRRSRPRRLVFRP